MTDLSIIVPARNEMFLNQTVENILENIEADTEVIVIADGGWPEPPLPDNPRVTVVHHTVSIGQRAATNEGARISQAKYVMKIDAHCAVGKGFDAKLIQDCQPDWTLVPQMANLHAFSWKCVTCGDQTYQGVRPKECGKCKQSAFERVMVWEPRRGRITTSWRLDSDLHFQYWKAHRKRPEAQGDLIETMSCIGCCFLMERERFWKLGGMDEGHGSWGQYGCELACKAWLSGGKLMTSKKTWQAHLFRTGNFSANGESTFPYPLSQQAINRARAYSQDYWRNNRMPNQVHPLSWLVERFAPVPGWSDEDLAEQKEREVDFSSNSRLV